MFRRDGFVWFSGDSSYSEDKLEFHPDVAQFPRCYTRFRWASFAHLKVPQETVLYPLGEAAAALAGLATVAGSTQADTGALGTSDPVFVLDSDCVPTFASKTLKAIFKEFRGEEKNAFKDLKEIKPFGLLLPSTSDQFPEWEGLTKAMTAGKLKNDCATVQLKEPFPVLTKGLIDAEFSARQAFGRALTGIVACETSQMKHTDFSLAPLLAKLAMTWMGDTLRAWMKARRACRSHIFVGAQNYQEPKALVDSTPFSESLFPKDIVEQVLSNALRAGKSLHDRWAMYGTASSSSSTTSGSFKRKQRGQGRGSRPSRPRGATPNFVQSPASVPSREGGDQPSRGARGAGRGGKGRGRAGRSGRGRGSGASPQ